MTSLSPDISILDNENPLASIATIAFLEVPVIPSMSPDALELILTALPTPLTKCKSSISALPPVRETPVPVCVKSAPVKATVPVEASPVVVSLNTTSESVAWPLILNPSLSTLSIDNVEMSAWPATSIPIKQSSIVSDVAVRAPSAIIHDFAFEIVTLSRNAVPP